MHPVGKKFVQSLNLYHRLAFARLLHEANEAQNGSLITTSTANLPHHPSTSTAPSTATQSKQNSSADLSKDGLPNGINTLASSFASQCSREGMPITDVLSSSLSNYSRSASPGYF